MNERDVIDAFVLKDTIIKQEFFELFCVIGSFDRNKNIDEYSKSVDLLSKLIRLDPRFEHDFDILKRKRR